MNRQLMKTSQNMQERRVGLHEDRLGPCAAGHDDTRMDPVVGGTHNRSPHELGPSSSHQVPHPGRHSTILEKQRDVRVAVRVGAQMAALHKSERQRARPNLWVRVGVTKAGAHVYFVLHMHAPVLRAVPMRGRFPSMATAGVWRVDVGVGRQRPMPVDVCMWVPRPCGPAVRQHVMSQAVYRSGICLANVLRQPYVALRPLTIRIRARWQPRPEAYQTTYVCMRHFDHLHLLRPPGLDEIQWLCPCGALTSVVASGHRASRFCVKCLPYGEGWAMLCNQ